MIITGTPRQPGEPVNRAPHNLYVHLEAQGNLLAIKPHHIRLSKSGGGRRGNVTTFSRQSRLRLLRKTARIRPKKAVFLTLTYPKRYPTQKRAKGHLRAFLERIRRRYPQSSGIWRLELQQRGAPHFHLIMFGIPFVHWRIVRQWWADIIAEFVDDHAPRIKIEMIWSTNGVMYYVAKYCAKEATDTTQPPGEQKIPVSLSTPHICTPTAIKPCDVMTGMRLQASIDREATEDTTSGRVWGVFNKGFIPYAPGQYGVIEQITFTGFEYAKEAFREIFPHASRSKFRGCAIFTQGAYWYYEQIIRLLIPDMSQSPGGFWIGQSKHGYRGGHKIRNSRKDRRVCAISIHASKGLRHAKTLAHG